MLVIGHRGAPSLAPENTIPSFTKAIELGVDYIEFDVRTSKDEVLVVIHDDKVDRITDSKGLVSELTWKQLTSLDAGSWFSKEFEGVRIPSLDEVLRLAKEKACVVVSIKDVGIEFSVLDSLSRNSMIGNSIIVAPIEVAKRIKEAEPSAVIMYNLKPSDDLWKDAGKLASDGVSIVNLRKKLLTKEIVDFCHREGLMVDVTSVNEESEVQMCIEAGVDFIMSDEPQLTVEIAHEGG